MTLNEFKAWLEGYEASFDIVDGKPVPGSKQWAEIKARLTKVTQTNAALSPDGYRQRPIWPAPMVGDPLGPPPITPFYATPNTAAAGTLRSTLPLPDGGKMLV